jgi:hypothetical protein
MWSKTVTQLGIHDFRDEEAGQSSWSFKPHHVDREGGGGSGSMLLQRLCLVTDCRPSFNCHIYRSATKGEGRGQLSHPLTTKPQQILLSSLYYSDDGNIKVKLYELELWATSAERTWLPSVSVICSFGKQYKCVMPYIQTYYATQISKSVLSRQNRDVCDPYIH